MMSQDYKLGFRMLARFPGLTIAGGLALAIAIGVGAGWYDISRKLFAPEMPIPDGGRIVLIETRNVLTNETEPRVAHDFLEWRRGLRTITELGAYHAVRRNVTVGDAVPMTVQTADITASAFRAAHVAPIRGRGLLDTDDVPGAPFVAVIGYDLWQRAFMGRDAAIGSVVKVGATPATVVGVMPEGFTYPVNQVVWMPLQLRDSYAALEGGALSVIGRLAPGMTGSQANAELGVVGERTATVLAATHQHLRPRVVLPGGIAAVAGLTRLAISNGPALLVLLIACMNVGTLFYARTATREGEIAVRSALGASRRRIVGQMFVEALVLALVAAGVGLLAADRVLRWGIEQVTAPMGGPPFWATPGLELTTIVYAVSTTLSDSSGVIGGLW